MVTVIGWPVASVTVVFFVQLLTTQGVVSSSTVTSPVEEVIVFVSLPLASVTSTTVVAGGPSVLVVVQVFATDVAEACTHVVDSPPVCVVTVVTVPSAAVETDTLPPLPSLVTQDDVLAAGLVLHTLDEPFVYFVVVVVVPSDFVTVVTSVPSL
jgi:hypothetical protein